MDTQAIVEHIAILRREIEEIKTMNTEFWGQRDPSATEKALFRARQARLTEIHSELKVMLGQVR